MSSRLFRLIPILLACVTVLAVLSCSRQPPSRSRHVPSVLHPLVREDGHVISGRLLDPQRLLPENAQLLLGMEHNGSFSSFPLAVAEDGSFTSPRLAPGMYVLNVRPPSRPHELASARAFALVSLGSNDVTGVRVLARHDTTINGRFRMRSDDPGAAWPRQIVVQAFLALDGAPLLAPVIADGADGGRFTLRNAFGPRVIRCGYSLGEGGSRWWPDRVLLNGVDITNVPTDFGQHNGAELEVWFTQHPARLCGRVVDSGHRPAPGAWVLLLPAEASLRQRWAETIDAQQADAQGRFTFCPLPGRYLLRAVPSATYPSWRVAREQVTRYSSESALSSVTVGDREMRTTTLTCDGCR